MFSLGALVLSSLPSETVHALCLYHFWLNQSMKCKGYFSTVHKNIRVVIIHMCYLLAPIRGFLTAGCPSSFSQSECHEWQGVWKSEEYPPHLAHKLEHSNRVKGRWISKQATVCIHWPDTHQLQSDEADYHHQMESDSDHCAVPRATILKSDQKLVVP